MSGWCFLGLQRLKAPYFSLFCALMPALIHSSLVYWLLDIYSGCQLWLENQFFKIHKLIINPCITLTDTLVPKTCSWHAQCKTHSWKCNICVHILIAFQSTINHTHLSMQIYRLITRHRHGMATKILSDNTRRSFFKQRKVRTCEEKHNLLPSWVRRSTVLSYLVKIAGAAVAVCVVSHPYAGHLYLKEEQRRRRKQQWMLVKATSMYSSKYVRSNVLFSNMRSQKNQKPELK